MFGNPLGHNTATLGSVSQDPQTFTLLQDSRTPGSELPNPMTRIVAKCLTDPVTLSFAALPILRRQ